MTTTPTTPMSPAGPPQFDPNNPKAAAKAAKAYAKATRPWYKKKRFLLPIALVVIIAISQASGGDGGSTAPDTKEQASVTKATDTKPNATEKVKAKVTAKVKAKPAPKAIPVKAAKIVKEFEDNELAADAKYKGKTLRITGVVEKIDTELLDDEKYILQLGGGGDFEVFTVNCHDMSTKELSTLKKGDNATVIGEFDDGGDLGVDAKNCALA